MSNRVDGLIVYIVDDDASVRTGLARLMRSVGYRPILFETGEAFLAAVHSQESACLVLDITMPRITGLRVQELMQQRGVHLPVVAISARDDEDTRNLARALGAQLFLRKPVDDQALLDAIEWVSGAGRV